MGERLLYNSEDVGLIMGGGTEKSVIIVLFGIELWVNLSGETTHEASWDELEFCETKDSNIFFKLETSADKLVNSFLKLYEGHWEPEALFARISGVSLTLLYVRQIKLVEEVSRGKELLMVIMKNP